MDMMTLNSSKSYTDEQISKVNKEVDILYKLNKGQTYDFETKAEVGQNEAPSGAESVSVVEASGNTTQDGEPTPDNPIDVVGVNELNFRINGRNLCQDVLVANYTSQYASVLRCKINIQPNTTYTVSFVGQEGNALYLNEKISTQVNFKATGKRQSITFVTNSNPETASGYVAIFKNRAEQSNPNKFDDVQIELGSVAHDYDSYSEETHTIIPPRPLHKIGEYADKLICDDKGNWKWEFNVYKQSFSPNWKSNGEGTIDWYNLLNAHGFDYDLSYIGETTRKKIRCTHYISRTQSFTNSIACWADYAYVKPSRALFATESDAINWMNENSQDIFVYYPLEQSQTESVSLSDVDYLESISGTPTDKVITITDQNGNDVSWVAEYIINLKGVSTNE